VGRVRVNLASGSVFEKPLITCFKGTNGNYIVLDNETNGSMGLPIICIGRLDGTTISKIVDPTEWASVKENLKTIIAGTALPYLPVPETLSANDEFYTQLTLPIASFDLLKNTYKVESAPVEVTPAPVAEPVVEQPMADISPIGPTSPIDISPISMPETPVVEAPVASPIPEPTPIVPPVEPVPVTPQVVQEQPVSPVEETPVTINFETVPIEPAVPPVSEIPVSEPVPTIETPVMENPAVVSPFEMDNSIVPDNTSSISDQDLQDMKETFMKSCENMFDALVEKLKK